MLVLVAIGICSLLGAFAMPVVEDDLLVCTETGHHLIKLVLFATKRDEKHDETTTRRDEFK